MWPDIVLSMGIKARTDKDAAKWFADERRRWMAENQSGNTRDVTPAEQEPAENPFLQAERKDEDY
jgi:hypothetical protein